MITLTTSAVHNGPDKLILKHVYCLHLVFLTKNIHVTKEDPHCHRVRG